MLCKALQWLPTVLSIKPTLPATAHSHPHTAWPHLAQPFSTVPLPARPGCLTVTQTGGVLTPLGVIALTQLRTGPAPFDHLSWNVTPSERPSLIHICNGPTPPHLLCLLCGTLSTSSLPRAADRYTVMLGIMRVCIPEDTPALSVDTCRQASGTAPVGGVRCHPVSFTSEP